MIKEIYLTEEALNKVYRSFSWECSTLVVVNAQKALLASIPQRSNFNAEKNIQALLSYCRARNGKIIHVQHVSENPRSDFYI